MLKEIGQSGRRDMGKESIPLVSLQGSYRKRGLKVKYLPFSGPARAVMFLLRASVPSVRE
jgi:hypothetical protein